MENSSAEYYNLAKKSSYYSIITVIIILLAKIYAWTHTNSVAIFASMLDSFFDLSACVVNLVALQYSSIPPDDNHRFGHNKIEDMAIFAQSMFFIGSSFFMLFHCIDRVINPETMVSVDLGIKVIILSIILNLALVAFQSYVIKKTKALVVEADKLHFLVDAMANIATLVALYTSRYWDGSDILCGVLISAYMLYSSYKLLRVSWRNLLDEEFTTNEKQVIIDTIANYKDILGLHELKTRSAGNKKFIQFHIELDGQMTLYEAHKISDSVMHDLENKFPGCEVMIHQDPEGVEENLKYQEIIIRKN